MREEIAIYWRALKELYSNEELLSQHHNPLIDYEKENENGAIIDIGCSQSVFVLEYLMKGRVVYALDADAEMLSLMRKRVDELELMNTGKVIYLNRAFPEDDLPEEQFSIIILSNVLHFFTLEACATAIQKLLPHTKPGTLVFIQVHSKNHRSNNPTARRNGSEFLHFFDRNELDALFLPHVFERVYSQEVEASLTIKQREFSKVWIERVFSQLRPDADEAVVLDAKESYSKNSREDYIISIYRKL